MIWSNKAHAAVLPFERYSLKRPVFHIGTVRCLHDEFPSSVFLSHLGFPAEGLPLARNLTFTKFLRVPAPAAKQSFATHHRSSASGTMLPVMNDR